jgi:spermidine synthase
MGKISFVKTSQVYLIFTASGATALVYQVIWSRWLGLLFGNTTTSISIVLGSFMLGLALGSWGAGRFLHRIRNPVRAYAYVELGIGIFALCFPLLSRLTDHIFTLAVSTETSIAFSIFTRALLAIMLLLLPTSFMGATLPLLTDFFRRRPRHTRTWKVGFLYAANTLGAALGILLAGFLLIELLGVWATTLLAALLNFSVAFLALKWSSSVGVLPQDEPAVRRSRKLDINGKLALAVLTASGVVALASEVLWTRTLETLVGNSTYAFSMIVLLYLVGIAAGSWLMSMIVNRLTDLPLWIASMQLGMGIWIFLALILFNAIIGHISQYKGVLVPLPIMFWNYLQVMGVLLPLSLISGACFTLATRMIHPTEEEAKGVLIAKAYTWNTCGAVVGSLLAGFSIAPHFDYFDSLYVIALLYCITSFLAYLIIGFSSAKMAQTRWAILSLSAVSVVMIGMGFFKMTESSGFAARINARDPRLQVVYHRPGLQGVTTIIQGGSREAPLQLLLVNGAGMTLKVTETKMMAHLPMLLHRDPRDTLIICFGMGTTYRSAITYGGNVTAVELVKEVLDAFEYFYQDASRVRAYAKGRMVVNDGRSYLKLTREKYDVITVDPPPPIDAAGVNHLYSKEFLQLAKDHLKKGGIMAHWIPYPGVGGIEDPDTATMLVLTFADVFPYVYIKPSIHRLGLHILGLAEPLEISIERVSKRLSNGGVADDLREWDSVPIDYFQDLTRYRAPMIPGCIVTDDRPLLEFYLLRTWQKAGKKTFAVNYW